MDQATMQGGRDRSTATFNAAGADQQAPMSPGDEAPEGTPGTGENVCPHCAGSGRRGDQACPMCQGTGKVITGIGGA